MNCGTRTSLPEQFSWVYQELVATNQRLHDLGIEATNIVQQVKSQIGTSEVLDKFENIAKNAMKGVLCINTPGLRRCKWWNRGHCKEGTMCSYNHPLPDCQQHLQDGHCTSQGCSLRHRRRCKFFGTPAGCFRREKCQYLHQHESENMMQSEEVKVVKENSKEADKNGEQDEDVKSTESIESTNNNEESEGESNEHDCVYYICGICGYECKTEKIRKIHMTTKHRDYSECWICYTMVSADETMDQHVNSNHNGD